MERLRGTKLYKLRTSYERKKIFGDPEILTQEAHRYFDWCDRNPFLKTELVKYKGSWTEAEVPYDRPYTMDGLTYYLGVSGGYFRASKANLKNKIEAGKASAREVKLLEAIELIEQAVRANNIEGAAVGIFSPALVARIHGVAENINTHNTGDAVIRVSVRDKQTADDLDKLDRSL